MHYEWQLFRSATARRRWGHTTAKSREVGGDVAVFASARKLATLIYRLLRWGQPYVDEGVEAFEKRYRNPDQLPKGQGQGTRISISS